MWKLIDTVQDWLDGKKTTLTALVMIVLNALVAFNVITVENQTEINAALLGFIAWFLRLGISK